MNLENNFQPSYFSFNIHGDNFTEVVTNISLKLQNLDLVKETYLDAVLRRETEFPTGLITKQLNIGIPHTDPEHVNKPFVFVVRLLNPIKMKQMGDNKEIFVSNLFFLGITNPADQVMLLQMIMDFFMDDVFVERFIRCSNEIETYELFSKEIKNKIKEK